MDRTVSQPFLHSFRILSNCSLKTYRNRLHLSDDQLSVIALVARRLALHSSLAPFLHSSRMLSNCFLETYRNRLHLSDGQASVIALVSQPLQCTPAWLPALCPFCTAPGSCQTAPWRPIETAHTQQAQSEGLSIGACVRYLGQHSTLRPCSSSFLHKPGVLSN